MPKTCRTLKTYLISITMIEIKHVILNSKSSPKAGICSEERSMISPDYARNFICDFIIGKKQTITELELF